VAGAGCNGQHGRVPEPSEELRIPDDARALARDVMALDRERRAARRRARLRRLVLTRRWHAYGISGPIVFLCLSVVGVAALGLALLVPHAGSSLSGGPPRQLASPAVAVGAVGGLLPDVALAPGGAQAHGVNSARSLRPAIVALVQPGCGCAAALHRLLALATNHQLPVYEVARVGGPGLVALTGAGGTVGSATALVDGAGRLSGAYPVEGDAPTVLLVDATGVVDDVLPGFTAATPVAGRLDRLVTQT